MTRETRGRAGLSAAALALCAVACSGDAQSALAPAGPQAARIATLWWVVLGVVAVIWVVVMAVLARVVLRGRRRTAPAMDASTTRAQTRAVAGALAATLVILVGLALADYATGRELAALGTAAPPAVTIHLTGHQWWWEAQYEHAIPARRVTTANEIHIPTGVPVLIRATSRDVIHSFWVPNLHGKRDLVPGRTNQFHIQADRPGVYRGQCAEFCGHQHAKMGLLVIAQPPDSFAAWYEAQLLPAAEPADSITRRGQEVFLAGPCVMCHTIRGTPAGSRVGPELTHLAGRRTIAAASLPNRRGYLAGWILDSQRIKPGNRMPPIGLASEDLEALLAYLESLR